MSRPEDFLYHNRGYASREDETEVTRAFGEGDQLLSNLSCYGDLFDAVQRQSLVHASYAIEVACLGNWDHHHTCCSLCSLQRGGLHVQGMPDNKFFQGHACSEVKCARTEAPDGTSRYFE